MKDFKKKIELCRYACTTYEKTLIELRSFMRGVSFDKESYLDQLKTVDDIIIDMCLLVGAFGEKYKKKFTCDYLLYYSPY